MIATKLQDKFKGHLVSVIPPDAPISPKSKIPLDQRGKVPGRKYPGGWGGYKWREVDVTAEELERTGANIGIRGSRYPALDIDVDNPKLSQAILAFAQHHLGEGPVRLSREPRRLLVFASDDQISKLSMKVEYEGEWHLVEWLGAGQQYLIHGRHPAGHDYRWVGEPLWEHETLPSVTRDEAVAFMDELAAALRRKGMTVKQSGTGDAAEAAADQDSLKAPTLEALEGLPLPPNPDDYGWDEFIAHGYAFKAAGQDDEATAYERWVAWAEQHDSFDPDVCEHEWSKIRGPYRAGWSWLCEQAGHQDAADVFGVIEGADDGQAPVPTVAGFQVDASAEWTDERVVATLLPAISERLRYIPANNSRGVWRVWSGHAWQEDPAMEHELLIRDFLTRLSLALKERAAAMSGKEGVPLLKAATRYQGDVGIRAIARLLRAHLACAPRDFDADPWLLNTPGGVVNLKTGAIRENDPSELMARSTSIAPAEGEAPRFKAFLHDLTGGDLAMQRYIQKLMGYFLTGSTAMKELYYAWGGTDTGKSALVRLALLIFGDYSDSVDPEVFISKQTGRIPAELARLPGVRLVTATEPAAGTSWNEKRVKEVTGGDTIEARFLHGNPFTYQPVFKLLIVGNSEPEIEHVDDAMLRRIKILPLDHRVPKHKQIDRIEVGLVEEEGPQILAWMIEGCLLWQEEGLEPPTVVREKTAEYAAEEDTLRQWIMEQCDVETDEETPRQNLYNAWSQWCRSRGELPGGARGFKRKMDLLRRELGFKDTQIGDRRLRGYAGIRLHPTVEMGTVEI